MSVRSCDFAICNRAPLDRAMTSSPNTARGRSRSPHQRPVAQLDDSQALSPMRPVAQPEEESQLSPMRPVAQGGATKSTIGVGSPEPRVRAKSRSGSPNRPALYYSPMRPVAQDNLIPANTMKINFKTQTGKTITLDVEESDTIHNVLESLDWCHGVDARGKKLMKGCPEAVNMGQLNLQPGDTLYLVDPPSSKTIHVKTPTGKIITVGVDVSDTIEDVKRKILSRLDWMEGPDNMVLSLHLEDGKNFSDYSIPGSVYIVYMLPAYAMPRTP